MSTKRKLNEKEIQELKISMIVLLDPSPAVCHMTGQLNQKTRC